MDDLRPQEIGSTKLERAARVLREAILRGQLVPGQKLKQQELAQWLDMSATPIREVLRILVAEGLLVHVPNKGVCVAEISLAETEEIAPIRAALERLAVELSVPRLTTAEIEAIDGFEAQIEEAWRNMDLAQVRRCNYEFHTAIYRASGSPILCTMIERLWPRFPTDLQWMTPGRSETSNAQHRAIVGAIRQRDASRAGGLMAEHIISAGKCVVEFLKQQTQSSPQLTHANLSMQLVHWNRGDNILS